MPWPRHALAAAAFALGAAACNAPFQPDPTSQPPGQARFPATIVQPAKLSSVESGKVSTVAQELRVPCLTCHSLRAERQSLRDGKLPEKPEELQAFHVGMVFQHGDNRCSSCHVPDRADQLHLANGEKIPTSEAIRLCAQCHGTQWRNYQHGAHGGMTGYWDLSRGPRARNHCVECHDPHAPKYVGGLPVLEPRDRRPLATKEGHLALPAVASLPSGAHR